MTTDLGAPRRSLAHVLRDIGQCLRSFRGPSQGRGWRPVMRIEMSHELCAEFERWIAWCAFEPSPSLRELHQAWVETERRWWAIHDEIDERGLAADHFSRPEVMMDGARFYSIESIDRSIDHELEKRAEYQERAARDPDAAQAFAEFSAKIVDLAEKELACQGRSPQQQPAPRDLEEMRRDAHARFERAVAEWEAERERLGIAALDDELEQHEAERDRLIAVMLGCEARSIDDLAVLFDVAIEHDPHIDPTNFGDHPRAGFVRFVRCMMRLAPTIDLFALREMDMTREPPDMRGQSSV